MKKKKLISQIDTLEHQNNLLSQENSQYQKIQFDLKIQVKNLQEANAYLIESNRLMQQELANLRAKLSIIPDNKQTETNS